LVLLTTIAMVAHGPRSAVVYGYFLIVALAGLRFQLRLVWFATLGAMLAYLVLLGYARWWVPDALRSEMTVPRYQQLLFLASLALLGAMVGQIVRRARHLVMDFHKRMTTSVQRPPEE
jgi:hypothetical protein